ncbi:MAG: sigma 54-interacting transcriptional regulator [Labilithrix sp.]|nr:sigma 54-interacting transcriptional regulator [Labilithrix sp.]
MALLDAAETLELDYSRVARENSRGKVPATARVELVTIVDGCASVHRFPAHGSLVLGRGGSADLDIDHASVSRKHARLHLGDPVVVEDLGSANGTRLLTTRLDALSTAQTVDQRLAPNARTTVGSTTSIHLGSVVVLVRYLTDEEPALPTGMVVASPAMKALIELVDRIAISPLSVLLVGETGAGKDVVARTIHARSPRARGPLVAINCAALPEQLIEAELFGHDRGAFTGATIAKPGLLETASSGTAFLDEIGELPLAHQGKMLRVLEGGEVQRVGALKPRPIDVRFVAATNRDLAREVERGTFRRDLFYRLAGMTLTIPPLRERREDVLPLARHFAEGAGKALGRPAPELSPAALEVLERHSFPGNVRELRNVIERAAALAGGPVIAPEHLRLDPASAPAERAPAAQPRGDEERQRIVDALAQCAGNQTRAAELLGISRRTLVNRLGEYGIARPLRERR